MEHSTSTRTNGSGEDDNMGMGAGEANHQKWVDYDKKQQQRRIQIASQNTQQRTIRIVCRVHGNCKNDHNKNMQACLTCIENRGQRYPLQYCTNKYTPIVEGVRYL